MDRDTDGQGLRRTGRGAGTQMDRNRERDTVGQEQGEGNRRTGTGRGMRTDREWNRET